jgi:serine/threonine-protein kinase
MAMQTGQPFGNYRIVRLIGEGGFGEVYLAENPLIERRAAVKVLHPNLAQDTESIRRFLNEARAASAIRHPNIIDVLDAGVTPEGVPYILMEFLDGISLQKRLANSSRLALAEALQIAAQAGSALSAAHVAGIVHRDLKPENLFLVPDPSAPGGERVKILDFGIAKITTSAGDSGTIRTRTGLIMGSPAYMSPEQCKDSADVDLRSDIYSFAIIIYQMLAGRPPFTAASGTELLVMHLTGTPRPLQDLVPEVPVYVDKAIARALSRQREDRFDNIASFLGAMRADVEQSASSTRRLSPTENLPAVANPTSRMLPETARLPAATTLSQTRGEVQVAAIGKPLLTATQPRRWPFFALAGLVLLGVAMFALLRPSHSTVQEATLGLSPGSAAPAPTASPPPAAQHAPPAPAAMEAVPTLPNRPDAGTPPRAPGRSPTPLKRSHATSRQPATLPATQPGRSEEEWLAH